MKLVFSTNSVLPTKLDEVLCVRQSLQGHYLYSDQCRIDNRYYQMSPPNNCSAEVLINAKSGQLECEKQARKPRSYARPKLCRLTH